MSSVSVKEAEDLEDLLDLYTAFYNELRLRQGLKTYNRDELREDVKSILARDKVFLASMNGRGFVGFIRVSQREGCYWIEELYVKPEYRSQGIGRRLVKTVEDYIARHDSSVYLMVLPQDRRAMKFWLHMGYTLLNTIELAKDLKPSGKVETRAFPVLSDVVEIYKWAKEDYSPLEEEFLELVEEFKKRGGRGEELLEEFVKVLKAMLEAGMN